MLVLVLVGALVVLVVLAALAVLVVVVVGVVVVVVDTVVLGEGSSVKDKKQTQITSRFSLYTGVIALKEFQFVLSFKNR